MGIPSEVDCQNISHFGSPQSWMPLGNNQGDAQRGKRLRCVDWDLRYYALGRLFASEANSRNEPGNRGHGPVRRATEDTPPQPATVLSLFSRISI